MVSTIFYQCNDFFKNISEYSTYISKFSPHLHDVFIFVGEAPQYVYKVGSRKSYVICCSEPSFVNRTTNPPEQSKNPKLHTLYSKPMNSNWVRLNTSHQCSSSWIYQEKTFSHYCHTKKIHFMKINGT